MEYNHERNPAVAIAMPSDTNIDTILARFPGPVTPYPSKKKWLLILLVGALFTAGGYLMIIERAPWGWFVFAFFACGSIIAAVMLLPGAGALTLDQEGFQTTSLFRRYHSRWHDTAGLEVVSVPPSFQKMVVYDDAKATGKAMAKLSAALAGHNAGLPDTYGLSADDLARLMNQWRARAGV